LTKIIATLGPATRSESQIAALVAAGVDVVRLNFSHGTYDEHATSLRRVRAAAAAAGRHVAILQDLSGLKIRTGRLEGSRAIQLRPGDRLTLVIGDIVGTQDRISTTYAPLATAVRAGDRLLLDDGRIDLDVQSAGPDAIVTRVVDGGELGEHKGIHAPNVPLPAVGVTDKDAADLRFGIELGVDLAALSFVQSATDVSRARQIASDAGRPDLPVVAKLERPEAIERLDEIVAAADAVMVARGDLGLELPLERVPRVQKAVLRTGRQHGVAVIVATQVLESMRTDARPTRAEVSDAAGAVDGGADAIMLSGETAVGAYPVRAVEVLDAIIRDAEALPPPWVPAATAGGLDHVPALCDAAVTLASHGHADALVAMTREGRTARLLSTRRPPAPVYAVTDRPDLARRLALWWGIVPTVSSLDGTLDDVLRRAVPAMRAAGLPAPATVVVVNASRDLDQDAASSQDSGRGRINVLGIRRV
jgi:pyruvate kinase